jgi:hypothetical protein
MLWPTLDYRNTGTPNNPFVVQKVALSVLVKPLREPSSLFVWGNQMFQIATATSQLQRAILLRAIMDLP